MEDRTESFVGRVLKNHEFLSMMYGKIQNFVDRLQKNVNLVRLSQDIIVNFISLFTGNNCKNRQLQLRIADLVERAQKNCKVHRSRTEKSHD